jgi:hypothetical protein
VQYQLKHLVISTNISSVTTVGLNELWMPSSKNKYCVFMIKLFNTMIQSRDENPSHDKHAANVLGDLHTNLTSSFDLITFIQQ